MGTGDAGLTYPADSQEDGEEGLQKPCQTTKVLPLDNPVRVTTRGVKVAPWGGPGRRLRRERMSLCWG